MWLTVFAFTIAMSIGFTVLSIVIESRQDGVASVR